MTEAGAICTPRNTIPGYIVVEFGKEGRAVKKPSAAGIRTILDIQRFVTDVFPGLGAMPEDDCVFVFHTTTLPERRGARVLIDDDAMPLVFPVISDLIVEVGSRDDYAPDEFP